MSEVTVLHVGANRYPPFPAQHHTASVWSELAKGFKSYHVAARANSAVGSVSNADGVTLHLIGSVLRTEAEFLFTGSRILSLVKRIKPNVILCQCPVFGGIWAQLAVRGRAIRLLVELHGEHFFKDRQTTLRARLLQFLAIPALRRADSVRVLSLDMKESVRKTYGDAIASKCIVIPNRVDLKTFAPAKGDYASDRPLRLVTVGSFIPLKNHIELIESVTRMDHVELTLVGAGPLESEYRRVIEETGMADRIRIHGWVAQTELAKVLAAHDVYVHFSRTEAFSRAILEAMGMGLPVVATDVGFIAGILDDGQNALLLRAPWNEALISAVNVLADSSDLRERLGKRGRETVVRDFEWSAVFSRYRSWLSSENQIDTL